MGGWGGGSPTKAARPGEQVCDSGSTSIAYTLFSCNMKVFTPFSAHFIPPLTELSGKSARSLVTGSSL